MKSKSLILMFVSLGFGLVAAIGISQVMGRGGAGGGNVRTSPVVVAVDFLDINTELTDERVKVEQWPANIIPENAVRSMEETSNKSSVRAIPKGAPIFKDDIIDKNKAHDLVLKEGQRLISIKVGAEQIANGLMKPGDRVDIIGTFTSNGGGNSSSFSTTFLKNIQVYSVNEVTNREGPREATGAKQNSIVGILVNEKQAEKLVLVQKVGQLSFVLRGQSTVVGPEVAEEGEPLPNWLFTNGGNQPPDPKPIANLINKVMSGSKPALPKIDTMTIWHAGERTVVLVNPDGTLVPPGSNESKQAEMRIDPVPTENDPSTDVNGSDSESTENNTEREPDQYINNRS